MTNHTQAELCARSFQSQVARNPGAACLTLPILRALGVVSSVNALCASDHVVSHGEIVQLLTVNRLQAPRPLDRVQVWLAATGLATAWDVQPDQAPDTRLGETLDACYAHSQDIWQSVIQRPLKQDHLSLGWLPYDIKSVYFEGLYTESELVQFGYSRDHRPDSKQINLALNVTREGLPLTFRLLVGSTADSTIVGGHRYGGDEIVSLSRAFIYAGSPSVIASQWSVDDKATELLMTTFYTPLKQRMSKAAALRAAQADTRAKYPHPYYWAAFVLTGDPGQGGAAFPLLWLVIGFAGAIVLFGMALLRAKQSRTQQ